MKIKSSILFLLLFGACITNEKRESQILDDAYLEVQRQALWHREYYLAVLKWEGKNSDSLAYYEQKMDSTFGEYKYYLRKYNDLIEQHKKTSKN